MVINISVALLIPIKYERKFHFVTYVAIKLKANIFKLNIYPLYRVFLFREEEFMRKIGIWIFICTLLIFPSVFTVFGLDLECENNINEKHNIDDEIGSTIFWNKTHTVSIWIDKIYIFESGDREGNEPGEYFFKIYAFPQFWHHITDNYIVGDEQPEIPYDFGKLGAFKTKFTPQFILILAIDDDRNDGVANFNDFLGWKIIKLKPLKGDFPNNDPYLDIVKWDNPRFFNAVIKIFFSYYDSP